MITHWKVRNFKSFKNPEQVVVKPITVLAGANSSGKSSFLQSILLLKQTLQYGPANRPLSLNGPILKLGSSRSIHHEKSSHDPLVLGLTLCTKNLRNVPGYRRGSWHYEVGASYENDLETVDIQLEFSPPPTDMFFELHDGAPKSLSPTIQKVRVKVGRAEENEELSEYVTIFDAQGIDGYENSSGFDVKLDARDVAAVRRRRSLVKVEHGWISHFLPSWCWAKFNTTIEYAEQICISLTEGRSDLMSSNVSLSDEIPDELLHRIRQILPNTRDQFSSKIETFSDLRKFLVRNFRTSENTSRGTHFLRQRIEPDIVNAVNLEIISFFEDALVEDDYQSEPFEIVSMRGVREFVAGFLRSGVRYLGPLREAPRPVYQPEAIENSTSVGYNGEHTAAVYELNKSNIVAFYSPPGRNTAFVGPNELEERFAPLEAAVAEWLSYLEIASSVSSEDAGVYGNTLKVSPEGSSGMYDLTNVGVGVSQVLPIIVDALLADYGSLLILEQPELHLHPKVQARLADFLISIQRSGKQVILETHSEYMIDRLRLRIAQDESMRLKEDISILFSKKSDGETVLEEIEVNEFGAIVNWPKDFFDQTHSDASEILKIGRMKRNRIRRHDD